MKFSALLVTIVLLLALIISPEPYRPLPRAEAATFTVDTLVDESDGDFSAGDFSLREAVEQANANGVADEINFDAAILPGTITLGSQLTVSGDVTINGSGITLDGNIDTRIMEITSGTVTLNDLTFQNGSASFSDGGAIYNLGTLDIDNSTFSSNTADFDGGAIYNLGTLDIDNSTFSGNSADLGSGGAIGNGGTLTITGSTFSGNMALSGGAIRNDGTLTITSSTFSSNTASYGGTILNGDILTIANSTFSGNTATSDGGAIYSSGIATLTITNSTFSGNQAGDDSGAIRNDGSLMITNSTFSGNSADFGGAILNDGTATITNSTFSGNMASDGGAILNYGTLDIDNSTFSGNSADLGSGGAIGNGGTLDINNSTLSDNSATNGGAISNGSGTLTVTSSTFSGNTAADGGTIYNRGGTVTITSSTFSGNTATTDGGTLYLAFGTINVASTLIVGGSCSGTITDQGNNLSFNATSCPGTVADPGLGPLQNNGGPTDTMLPALIGPAVDAYVTPCSTTTDQRGVNRPQGFCDIGATEQNGNTTPLAASATCNGPNLDVMISSGDGPFTITASAGINTPVNGVSVGITTINGPEKWDDLTVTETAGNTQAVNLGQFRCRSDERPVPLSPAHRSRTTNPFPTFSWTGITNANNYRVFVFDDADPMTRTVDIRQNSGGPTSMQLSTPLPDGRLFWRARGRQNRIWSLWSIRFTLFKDPVVPFSVSTPVPTIEPNPPAGDGSVPGPAPTFPAPPNSR